MSRRAQIFLVWCALASSACFQLVPFTIARTCQFHSDCAEGSSCAAGICVKADATQGEAGPFITRVSALGPSDRLGAPARLRLEGSNLAQATEVNLLSRQGDVLARLTIESVTAAIVDVLISEADAASLAPGPLTVQLITRAARATRDVELLRGEPGLPGATGPTGGVGATGPTGNPGVPGVGSALAPLLLSGNVLSLGPESTSLRLGPNDFHPAENNLKHWSSGGVYTNIVMTRNAGEARFMVASLLLPDGAFVDRVRCYVFDDEDTNQFRISLYTIRETVNYGFTQCGTLTSNAACNGLCTMEIPLPALGSPDYTLCRSVNNRFRVANANQLFIQVEATDAAGTGDAATTLGEFLYCTVEYTH
ncbi:MAG: collagen-like protein [Deltaproteobacteria bacterium]|nr:collagen-like protein [Deltaproteobacteria bacterium]